MYFIYLYVILTIKWQKKKINLITSYKNLIPVNVSF